MTTADLPVAVNPAPGRPILPILVFAVLAAIVVYAVGLVLAPYITPILLAAVLATVTFPIYRRLRARLRHRTGLATTLMLLGVTLVLILPAFLLSLLLIQQATSLFELLQKTDVQQTLQSIRLSERLAVIQRVAPWFDPSTVNPEAMIVGIVKRVPALVAAHGGKVLGGLANLIISFFLMIFALYFFYSEGETIVREAKYLSPLPDVYDEELVRKVKDVVNATFRGQMLTAVAQGAVTSIGLAIAGIPGAFFWGAVAAVFGVLPMAGPAVVWIPAALYLYGKAATSGSGYGYAIFLTLWGVVVVGLVDNLIRPWAMRGGTKMSAVILFFAILGGLRAFGFVGIILGPLVFALFVSMIHIYKSFFRESLAMQNDMDRARGETAAAASAEGSVANPS